MANIDFACLPHDLVELNLNAGERRGFTRECLKEKMRRADSSFWFVVRRSGTTVVVLSGVWARPASAISKSLPAVVRRQSKDSPGLERARGCFSKTSESAAEKPSLDEVRPSINASG